MTIQSELDELKEAAPLQYEYVVARSQTTTSRDALAKVERSESWLQLKTDRDYLNALAERLRADRVAQAETMLRQAVTGAARVMIEDLQAKDRKLRQAAAKDILDRAGIKAPDKTQVEVIATIAARTLEDVLAQVYGKEQAQLPAGDIVDGEIVDGDIVDNADNN
jgi:hypothetical protein